MDRWGQVTPADFLFAVKGSRYLTHVKRLTAAGEPVGRLIGLVSRLRQKAGPILWQLPPQMKRNDDRLASFVSTLPPGGRHAFEFRHPSWFCQTVYEILAGAGAALCLADPSPQPLELTLTAGWTYLRLHHGDEEGSYSEAALSDWAGRIGSWAREGIDVYAYFNNDQQGFAPANARRLRELLASVC